MEWSHNGTWMVTSDDRGFVKYWQSNMNNVHTFQAHSEPVRSCRWDRVRSTCTFVCTSTGSNNVLLLPFNLPSTCSCCSVLMVFAAVVESQKGLKNHERYLVPHTFIDCDRVSATMVETWRRVQRGYLVPHTFIDCDSVSATMVETWRRVQRCYLGILVH